MQNKQIEDYPELFLWVEGKIVDGDFVSHPDFVEDKLLELAQQLESKDKEIEELQKQVEFKIEECITLAQACQRWKGKALNKENDNANN